MSDTNRHEKRKNKIVYRISLLNDSTHEKLYEIKARKHKAIAGAVSIVLGYTLLIICIIFFTPVRKSIPGYPTTNLVNMVYKSRLAEDSISRQMATWNIYLTNIDRLMSGETPLSNEQIQLISDSITRGRKLNADTDRTIKRKREDMSEGIHMPIKGMVSSGFNPAEGHPFLDIAADSGTNVSSIIDGTVISNDFSKDFGYSVHIQHRDNMISVYRHLSSVTVGRGQKVSGGQTIGAIGKGKDAGIISTGPHLHLEIWKDGEAVNPELYLKYR